MNQPQLDLRENDLWMRQPSYAANQVSSNVASGYDENWLFQPFTIFDFPTSYNEPNDAAPLSFPMAGPVDHNHIMTMNGLGTHVTVPSFPVPMEPPSIPHVVGTANHVTVSSSGMGIEDFTTRMRSVPHNVINPAQGFTSGKQHPKSVVNGDEVIPCSGPEERERGRARKKGDRKER